MKTIYKVRLMFERGGGCIWCGNDAALERFDVGPMEEKLLLSVTKLQELHALSNWHDKALYWEYPPAPSPWSEEDVNEFESAALSIGAKLQAELEAGFEVIYESIP